MLCGGAARHPAWTRAWAGGHWFGPADAEAVGILHLFGPHGDQGVVRTGPTAND